MSVRRINPRGKRHATNSRNMIGCCCDVIERLNSQVSGFVVIAWREDGYADYYCKTGGIVSEDVLPAYILSNIARK